MHGDAWSSRKMGGGDGGAMGLGAAVPDSQHGGRRPGARGNHHSDREEKVSNAGPIRSG